MSNPLTFPPLVERLVKGSELTFSEGDDNQRKIKQFCIALANLISASVNPDGTLVPNSVGVAAIQAAAVNLAALNPALLYQIVPVDNDIGTIQSSYVITARGGLGGTNLIPGGAVYDVNGNYTLNGLTLNYGYYWTKGANDTGIQSQPSPLTASGAFTALAENIVLTGIPGDAITATLIKSAPISAYSDGMIFFVYTTQSNSGSSTLNVNNLGAIPIKLFGKDLVANNITGPCVFAVVYKNGVFVLFSGSSAASSGSGGAGSVVVTTGYSGISQFSMPSKTLAGSYPTTTQVQHGLGAAPSVFQATLLCVIADAGFVAGQTVPLGEFTNQQGNGPAFSWSFDASSFYITELAAPYIINPSTGNITALTTANWVINATGSLAANYAGVAAFPALNYSTAFPEGAFSYLASLYIFSKSQFSNSAKRYINQINLLSNEVTPIAQVSSATPMDNVNGAVFSGSFGIDGSLPTFLFCCSAGLFYLPAINPGTNIIPGSTSYNSSGVATVSIGSADTFTWTPGKNDVSLVLTGADSVTYLASSAVNGQITVTVTGADTATFHGAPGTVITGTLISTSGGWSQASFSTISGIKTGNYKPAWFASSTAYCVTSDPVAERLNNLECLKVTSAAVTGSNTWATVNAASNAGSARLDLTRSDIANVAAFNKWYPAGSVAAIHLFQYNPILKRIYVMTEELMMIHIFQFNHATNDFQDWWNTASPTRENELAYVKTVAVGGGSAGDIVTQQQCHYTIEYDLTTGKESCIVTTRDAAANVGAGYVTRIPWTE